MDFAIVYMICIFLFGIVALVSCIITEQYTDTHLEALDRHVQDVTITAHARVKHDRLMRKYEDERRERQFRMEAEERRLARRRFRVSKSIRQNATIWRIQDGQLTYGTQGHPAYLHCHKCGADNEIVNQCGCDPQNLPTQINS